MIGLNDPFSSYHILNRIQINDMLVPVKLPKLVGFMKHRFNRLGVKQRWIKRYGMKPLIPDGEFLTINQHFIVCNSRTFNELKTGRFFYSMGTV